ncbi:helix-turn-helix domain-containing protein [Pseudovibrio ascidiaceicola]|uniref:helix-turn-helix domain-containing protein n=1 Tax=Pseudovibrio ascidiaceicola TaxID=285279 RepID=UPI000D69E4FB|nr:helix-turn-helix domain-containing protein [Pseudovibrio ascidiaceicola]
MTVSSSELANTKACYLEFNTPNRQTHFIESAFYLHDDGTLSAQSKGNFASPYASLRFEHHADYSDTPLKPKYTPPKLTASPKKHPVIGTIWGMRFKRLPPKTIQHPSYRMQEQIAAVLQQHTLARLNIEGIHQTLIEICDLLISSVPDNSLPQYADDQADKRSERTARRHFKAHMGLSPKPFAGLNRFHEALSDITRTNTSLTDIAYDHEFADQAHFSRDFREKTGHTPAQFRRNWRKTETVRFLQDYESHPALRLGIVAT